MPKPWIAPMALAALTTAAPAQTGSDAVTFTPAQEAVLLDANRITSAALRCSYTIDGKKLEAMLGRVGISERDMVVKKRSAALQQAVADDIRSYRDGKSRACADAFERYGGAGPFDHVLMQ